MIFLPTSRRWLLPALGLLIFVLMYRSIIHVPASVRTTLRFTHHPEIQYGVKISQEAVDEQFVPPRDPSQGHVWPDQKSYYTYPSQTPGHFNPYLEPLLQCRRKPNPYTDYIRLPNIVQSVSQLTSRGEASDQQKFNPTIIALPPWSPHQYLLVSRVVTEGAHQESLLCEADSCYTGNTSEGRRPREKDCTADDLTILGAAGGLRCSTPPRIVSIPSTPAEKCEGAWSAFPDIPGFHDPRVFWSGKGEPLIMVNSASRYACVGLWITDLRNVHEPLQALLESQPGQPYHPGPLMSYPSLTELTRNPAAARAQVEKNWFMFFPTPEEAFLHYDLSIPRSAAGERNRTLGGRTFAKIIGNGFTTPNLTDPLEPPCLLDEPDTRGKYGHWHQASNALKLILCRRAEAERGTCSEEQQDRAVHFAVMHRKFSNDLGLPLRYERFFVVWEARPPFRLLGMSRHPISMWNETASGWDAEENWAEEEDGYDDGDSPYESNHSSHRPPPPDDLAKNTTTTTTTSNEPTNNSQNQASAAPPNLLRRTSNTTTSSDITPSPPPTQPKPLLPAQQTPRTNWAYFTYTPSIAWSFRSRPAIPRREHGPQDDRSAGSDPGSDGDPEHTRTLQALNIGYLDDEVILGIGMDDRGQGVARVRAEELLACLRRCGSEP